MAVLTTLETNFVWIGCTSEAQNTVSNSTQYLHFIRDLKRYMISGVTLSFCRLWLPGRGEGIRHLEFPDFPSRNIFKKKGGAFRNFGEINFPYR